MNPQPHFAVPHGGTQAALLYRAKPPELAGRVLPGLLQHGCDRGPAFVQSLLIPGLAGKFGPVFQHGGF